mgnify:FL=1
MRVLIKETKIKLPNDIKEFLEKEISSLDRFLKRFLNDSKDNLKKAKPKVEARVEVKQKERGFYYVECNLHLLGKMFRAESLKKNLKSAIDEVKDELKRMIKDYKKKFLSKMKKRARTLKREIKMSQFAKN